MEPPKANTTESTSKSKVLWGLGSAAIHFTVSKCLFILDFISIMKTACRVCSPLHLGLSHPKVPLPYLDFFFLLFLDGGEHLCLQDETLFLPEQWRR